jgi:hypothetical protein
MEYGVFSKRYNNIIMNTFLRISKKNDLSISNVPYHLSVFDEENCESRERKLRYYYFFEAWNGNPKFVPILPQLIFR